MRTIIRCSLCLLLAVLCIGCEDEARQQQRITDFHRVAERGDLNEVRRVLASGFDPNARDKASGFTALHWAARAGQIDVMRRLLDAGADPNIVGRVTEITPLGMAIAENQQAAMLLLLEHGADPYANVRQDKNAFETADVLSKGELLQALKEWETK